MERPLRELLDKIYELEGLVHLALKRDDSSNDFLRLISKKGTEIGKICSDFKEDSGTAAPTEETNETQFNLEEYTIDEDPSDSYSLEKTIADEVEEVKPVINYPPSPRAGGKLVFSINERFRFKKELFENSDADFNNTLALVASMEDFEEAEDYFLNEVGFQRNNPVVMEFLDLIKRYFG